MPSASVRVGAWNVEWAKPGTVRSGIIQRILEAAGCDILCVTEGDAAVLPAAGHVVDAGTDWGYPVPPAAPGRRKVLLWSREPWTPVFDPVQRELPPGRLVAGVTTTPIGRLAVVGVCIPWRDAHVRTGRKDRAVWEDHLAWLAGFERTAFAQATPGTVVLGDFNQRIPRHWAPEKIHRKLLRAFARFDIATGGFLADPPGQSGGADEAAGLASVALPDGQAAAASSTWTASLQRDKPSVGRAQFIDHVAHSKDLRPHSGSRTGATGATSVGIFPKQAPDGRKLSDHLGGWLDLKKA